MNDGERQIFWDALRDAYTGPAPDKVAISTTAHSSSPTTHLDRFKIQLSLRFKDGHEAWALGTTELDRPHPTDAQIRAAATELGKQVSCAYAVTAKVTFHPWPTSTKTSRAAVRESNPSQPARSIDKSASALKNIAVELRDELPTEPGHYICQLPNGERQLVHVNCDHESVLRMAGPPVHMLQRLWSRPLHFLASNDALENLSEKTR